MTSANNAPTRGTTLGWILAASLTACAMAWSAGAHAQDTNIADEAKETGVSPTTSPRRNNYHSPTPLTVPGAKTIGTMELKGMLEAKPDLILLDVLASPQRGSIPNSVKMPGAGEFAYAPEKARLAESVANLTQGNKARPIVVYCLSWECWLSYNTSLYLVELGYTDVYWYRGGIVSWKAAKLPAS